MRQMAGAHASQLLDLTGNTVSIKAGVPWLRDTILFCLSSSFLGHSLRALPHAPQSRL